MVEYSARRCMSCREGIIIFEKAIGSKVIHCTNCLEAHEVRLFKNKNIKITRLFKKPSSSEEIQELNLKLLKDYNSLVEYLRLIQ